MYGNNLTTENTEDTEGENRDLNAGYDNLQAAMLGEKPVEEAVTDAAAAWNQR
ncbi:MULTISPECIES: hypothetical protein [unclassified Microcoleus]|uniref:hypothetical protein n=1 Tax=unclassified Microcoleus TaxID=2642155 RepID=UPI001E10E9AE|nr:MULTISPECIES: hypothetical protein [unclassified Microcoleus]MCC3505225.1 hypothetical protein [Microcoleus sp. PH2017_19_SFW_U_A]MCC3525095.1 hypothetical protein [Microcoleus sp. PH2017_20_SFW_D_A]MCC3547795.1 hypothetical protein [Microcoleus sp. PH2017_24_DOB_U_A]MCC3555909.1 hypothetical protein [Microcoleus sp. PH2017_35_SFW_U_B]MCC3566830.1 hypothetical protein [Microcoleus sp. PH2017_31_RDM_U_A]